MASSWLLAGGLVDEMPWELADGVELTPQMALRVQGDVLGTIALAWAGAGLAQTYQFAVARELARGELAEVLARTRRVPQLFVALSPRGRTDPSGQEARGVPGRGSPPRRRSLT
jgi:hypothetical protein